MPDVTPPSDRDRIHDVVVAELRSIIDPGPHPPAFVDSRVIEADARLELDLQLESLDLVRLAEALRERYGDAVDLMEYVSGLSLDEIIALSVADVVNHVMSSTGRSS